MLVDQFKLKIQVSSSSGCSAMSIISKRKVLKSERSKKKFNEIRAQVVIKRQQGIAASRRPPFGPNKNMSCVWDACGLVTGKSAGPWLEF